MNDILSIFCTFSLVAVAVLVCFLYSTGVEMLLAKKRGWYKSFLLCIAIILIQTFIYSWLPGRVGMEVTLMDEAITLEDGAIAHNLGYILISHAIGIGLAILKYIWSCIRKKSRFSGKFFLLELVIGAVLLAAGILLLQSDYAVDFGTDDSVARPVLYILAAAGLGLLIWGIAADRAEKKKKASEPSAEVLARFEEVVAKKKQLDQTGDYASQILLLTEALSLPLDGPRKARLWNYLGLANERIGSVERAEECYRNALKEDPDNPSTVNNQALLSSSKGDHAAARAYMEKALKNAKSRNMNLGAFYANYAAVEGKAGNKAQAEEMLKLAEKAGHDKAELEVIRNMIK